MLRHRPAAVDKGVIDERFIPEKSTIRRTRREGTIMHEFLGAYLAVDAANTVATSALPNAPVVDDGRANKPYVVGATATDKVRFSTAGALRRVANRVERRALTRAA